MSTVLFYVHINIRVCTRALFKPFFKKDGYTLASASEYSLIIRCCIENKIYDLNELNKYLEEYGYKDSLIY